MHQITFRENTKIKNNETLKIEKLKNWLTLKAENPQLS